MATDAKKLSYRQQLDGHLTLPFTTILKRPKKTLPCGSGGIACFRLDSFAPPGLPVAGLGLAH